MNEYVSGLSGCLRWRLERIKGGLEGEELMTSVLGLWAIGVVWGMSFRLSSEEWSRLEVHRCSIYMVVRTGSG